MVDRRFALGLLWLLVSAGVCADAPAIRVEYVQPGWPGAVAGLTIGDEIRAVRLHDGREWPVRDPWDWLRIEIVETPIAATTVIGARAGDAREWRVLPGDWSVAVAPRWAGADDGPQAAIIAATRDRDPQTACEAWRALAEVEPARIAAWALWRCARMQLESRQQEAAQATLTEALSRMPDAPTDLVDAARIKWAVLCNQNGAQQYREQQLIALAKSSKRAPQDALQQRLQLELVRLAVDRSRYQEALTQSAALSAALPATPADSVLAALNLQLRAQAERNLMQLEQAQASFEAALAMHARLGTEAFVEANGTRWVYGGLKRMQGDYAGAIAAYQAAIAAYRTLEPSGRLVASVQQNLSIIYIDQGDLLAAETVLNDNLATHARLDPEGLSYAFTEITLAGLATERQEYEAAHAHAERARAIFAKRAPDGHELASTMSQLGIIAERSGDAARAIDWQRQAVALWERIAPGHLRHTWALQELADMQWRRGEREAALLATEKVLALRRAQAPDGLDTAKAMARLARMHLELSAPAPAAELISAALPIYQRTIPDSHHRAEALNTAGRIARANGDPAAARAWLCEAVEVLERQRARISLIAERRARFVASQRQLYDDCIDASLQDNDLAAGLYTIERARARGLLELLSERADALEAELDPGLRASRDALIQRLGALSAGPVAPTQQAERERQMAELGEQLERHIARIRRESPAYAAVRYPQALSLDRAQQRLPANSAALIYALHEDRGWLLLLQAGQAPVRLALAFTLADAAALANRLRVVMANPAAVAEADALLREAHRRLLAPAEPWLQSGQRLIISADAELNLLPFSALRDAKGHYLIETHAISQVASLTVLDELSRKARPNASQAVLAAGDPDYRDRRAPIGDGDAALAKLPYSGIEARTVARTYARRGHALLGDDASEAAVRQAAATSAVVYLAVHGYFDPDRPANSGLLLTRSGADHRDDGIVQVWEVFSDWQLDAELVTLSACETALGQVLPTEGVLGLTRAFQYAGARAVVSSLWRVSDASTASLMVAFHRHRQQGMASDEALRQAQLAALKGELRRAQVRIERGVGGLAASTARPDHELHPAQWAAFVIHGDAGALR